IFPTSLRSPKSERDTDKSWEPFLQHESMVNITSRCAFIHVDIPGQEDSAPKLPAERGKI
ncbi:hypothetical protein MAR_016503, partial [Mya arenaria]